MPKIKNPNAEPARPIERPAAPRPEQEKAPTIPPPLETPEPPTPKPIGKPEEATPEAAPGVAPSYEPEKMEEAKKAQEMRRQKTAEKRKAKAEKAARPRERRAGAPRAEEGPMPRMPKITPALPGIGRRKKRPGVAGAATEQVMKMLKALRWLLPLISATCCNPCCWWFILIITFACAIAHLLGMI